MIYNKNKVIALLGLLLLPAVVYGAPLPDFTFKEVSKIFVEAYFTETASAVESKFVTVFPYPEM